MSKVTSRSASEARITNETKISVSICLDGSGVYEVDTGNGMFDHLLAQIARHGLIDLEVDAEGDSEVGWHHIVEDTAVCIGRALKEAVKEGKGITRMGHSFVPLDESLSLAVVDFSGRGYSILEMDLLSDSDLGDLTSDLIVHFLETLSREAGFNLHLQILRGNNNHHKAESSFKALARAFNMALSIQNKANNEVPSTKGTIT